MAHWLKNPSLHAVQRLTALLSGDTQEALLDWLLDRSPYKLARFEKTKFVGSQTITNCRFLGPVRLVFNEADDGTSNFAFTDNSLFDTELEQAEEL